jgi:hypothetical protein
MVDSVRIRVDVRVTILHCGLGFGNQTCGKVATVLLEETL